MSLVRPRVPWARVSVSVRILITQKASSPTTRQSKRLPCCIECDAHGMRGLQSLFFLIPHINRR